jgi:hypothetical protein
MGILLLNSGSAAFGFDFSDQCPGATEVVMIPGTCVADQTSSQISCRIVENGLPQMKMRSCVSGRNTSALESCMNQGDPCYVVHSKVYKADSYCESRRVGESIDVLASAAFCRK